MSFSLYTVGMIYLATFLILAIVIFIIRRKNSGISVSEAFERMGISIWLVIFDVISLPWKMFKGLFFVTNGDLSKGRVKFSLTRTVFGIGSFIMLFRLVTGGVVIEDVRFGPDVKSKSEKHISKVFNKVGNTPISQIAPTNTKKSSRRSRKRKVPGSGAKRITKIITNIRPWFYAKKIMSAPVTLYEILLYLMIIGLYYFRRDLAQGDNSGLLDKMLEIFGHAYAIKVSGYNPYNNQPTQTNSTIEVQTSSIVEIDPPQAPVTMPLIMDNGNQGSKRRRRKNSGQETIISEKDDPFLNR